MLFFVLYLTTHKAAHLRSAGFLLSFVAYFSLWRVLEESLKASGKPGLLQSTRNWLRTFRRSGGEVRCDLFDSDAADTDSLTASQPYASVEEHISALEASLGVVRERVDKLEKRQEALSDRIEKGVQEAQSLIRRVVGSPFLQLVALWWFIFGTAFTTFADDFLPERKGASAPTEAVQLQGAGETLGKALGH
ncbi:MAG: hypothetical protein WCG85_05910 [Polyangia bacterium]